MKESFKYRWGGRERLKEPGFGGGREMGYMPGACPSKTVVSDSCAGQVRPFWRLQDG